MRQIVSTTKRKNEGGCYVAAPAAGAKGAKIILMQKVDAHR